MDKDIMIEYGDFPISTRELKESGLTDLEEALVYKIEEQAITIDKILDQSLENIDVQQKTVDRLSKENKEQAEEIKRLKEELYKANEWVNELIDLRPDN